MTKHWLYLIPLSLPAAAGAEMMSLDDGEMSVVSGQSGLLIEAAVNLSIDAISYFDDDNGVSLRNVTLSAIDDSAGQAAHEYVVDVTTAGGILTQFEMDNTRLVIGDIVFSDDATKSIGSIIYDFNVKGTLHTEGYERGGLKFNLDSTLSDGRLVYREDGAELILDGINSTSSIRDLILSVAIDTSEPQAGAFVDLRLTDYRGEYSVDAIRFSPDVTSGPNASLKSYGAIRGDYHGSSDVHIRGGGRVGQSGLNIDVRSQLHSANFIYSDTGNLDAAGSPVNYELALKDISGHYELDNLTLDVAQGTNDRLGLLLGFDRLEGELRIGSIEAPRRLDPDAPAGAEAVRSFGSVDLTYHFADRQVGDRLYGNRFLIQAQGNPNAGNQGISIQAEWSLENAKVRYADDGNPVTLAGISSHGAGTVTLDMTRESQLGGTQFYDGIRLGFDKVTGSYRIDGLQVGDPVNGKEPALQGGTELLLALGLFPAYDFTIDGHYTFAPGGAEGAGITINADVHITNGNAGIAALRVDESEQDETGRNKLKGLWASGIDYDIHLRDMTIDVTDNGIAIVRGESWSTMDISNLRVGDKNTGGSFGRFVFQRYETGSSMTITPGGAGDVCVGGAGSDRSSCQGSGGIWEERGEQGVTVALKNIFANAVSEEKRNRFIWETNRRTDAAGNPINGTGTQLIVDNISTNDGVDGSNEYGFQNHISVDVYQTKVVKKETGVDSQGVDGVKGQEKIMDSSAPAGYTYATITDPNDPRIENRPLGFAVRANTSFKELSIDSISMKHPDAAAPDTMIFGMKLQNFDITSNLTATPIQ